mmetsp:Transcript_14555/g.31352  ORF Transcript_14555/g.31352 Transcript_14555/m.31352 type:complete len:204 (-) Transcript_14555:385-996(-)
MIFRRRVLIMGRVERRMIKGCSRNVRLASMRRRLFPRRRRRRQSRITLRTRIGLLSEMPWMWRSLQKTRMKSTTRRWSLGPIGPCRRRRRLRRLRHICSSCNSSKTNGTRMPTFSTYSILVLVRTPIRPVYRYLIVPSAQTLIPAQKSRWAYCLSITDPNAPRRTTGLSNLLPPIRNAVRPTTLYGRLIWRLPSRPSRMAYGN